MTGKPGDHLGNDYGLGASSTLAPTRHTDEQIRRAQVVTADVVIEGLADAEKCAEIREVLLMLGLKQITGLEKY